MHALTDETLNTAYRYATALAGDRDLAMDVVHSAYLKYVGSNSAPPSQPLAYFLRIVRNTYFDLCRSRSRWVFTEDEPDDTVVDISANSLEDMMIDKDTVARVWQRLSDPEREVLYLWAVQEFTIDEIAEQTDTPRGTLLARMHRLKKKFAKDVGPQMGLGLTGARS